MKSRFFHTPASRMCRFTVCCAVIVAFHITASAQFGQHPGAHTDTVGIDPSPILGPLPTQQPMLIDPIRDVPLIISEFRFRGPGGPSDEFVELYNTSSAPYTVTPDDESEGLALVASDGLTRFIIPAGTVIPAHGHYLAANSVGYTLGGYPAGNGSTASGDIMYLLDIADGGGIALFKTTNPAFFDNGHRVDAAGYSTAPALYREGAGFPTNAAEISFNIQYSFYRDLVAGTPKDTDDNVADFRGVDINGTNTGAGQHLGAPGPENLSSPLPTGTDKIQIALLDPAVSNSQPPNRVRDYTSDPENLSPLGTLSIRRTFTNVSSASITRLRFRIVDVTTYPFPSDNIADLRAISSGSIVVTRTDGSNVFVGGTTLETPPAQPSGGGWNSTMSANQVTLAQPLAPGASISLQFLLGVQHPGYFRFFIIFEALP